MWLLYDHKQPELAESFYNSVFCRLFDRSYFNNDHIFVKPGSAIDYLDMDDPVYRGYYPDQAGLRETFREILHGFGLTRPWEDLERDLDRVADNFQAALQSGATPAPHRQLHVVSSLFFRNKAAYMVGRALIGVDSQPFVIPILLNDDRQLYVDIILTEADDLALIFSFTHAYFMVNTTVPSGLVTFLQSILPGKTRADLYTSIGFQKQGKTLFYREFLHHLEHSTDKLITAPGIKGMVMSVFTLPSYPYVFKVIKDHFAPPKTTDRATVKAKYQTVKMHDRVGRMADTLEFSHVAFPVERFSDELLEALQREITSSIYIDGGFVIIRHLYIERRMVPFNIFLDHADEAMLERVVISYGNAIKEMIAANIFPGDMLLKNFGVTHAYFMVNTTVPSGLVTFLQSILPGKTRADLYTSIGFQKQGKTLFYREFLHHLEHSTDKLITAPGIKGMVMSVFTLPSYPYVFKVIKDHFAPPKTTDRATVKAKYQTVKMHDRVGRMADTLEFSHVAFPVERFSDELLEALQREITSSIYIDGGFVIIRHLYIERRMVPFNIFLDHADEAMLERVVISYGNAIKEMIAANIFPGDMLLKNFGVTRQNRVVFYDYDEICHMDEIKIRAIPKARSVEEEMAGEPWFHADENDFFPEQFECFVANHPGFKERFLAHHGDLLEPAYWKKVQDDILQNKRYDVFPYPQHKRFCHRYRRRCHG